MCVYMCTQAMRDRNYLYANDFYLRLAIGNAAWPIGVTSVGIHERSAREKISHVMNQSGQAHIMNDEATRKYLQVCGHTHAHSTHAHTYVMNQSGHTYRTHAHMHARASAGAQTMKPRESTCRWAAVHTHTHAHVGT